MSDEVSFKEPENVKHFTTWKEVFNYFSDQYRNSKNPDQAILVEGENLRNPDDVDFFDPSLLSFRLGADRVYRDKKDVCSLQIRVYDAGAPVAGTDEKIYSQQMYHIQLDWHNPDDPIGALKHFLVDVLKLDMPELERACVDD
jgi:hypothetical protein